MNVSMFYVFVMLFTFYVHNVFIFISAFSYIYDWRIRRRTRL